MEALEAIRKTAQRAPVHRPAGVRRGPRRRCCASPCWRPTGHNAQAWSLIVVRDPERRAALAELVLRGAAEYFRVNRPPGDRTAREHADWAAGYAETALGSYRLTCRSGSPGSWCRASTSRTTDEAAHRDLLGGLVGLVRPGEPVRRRAGARARDHAHHLPLVRGGRVPRAARDPGRASGSTTSRPLGYPPEFPVGLRPEAAKARRPWRTLVHDEEWGRPRGQGATWRCGARASGPLARPLARLGPGRARALSGWRAAERMRPARRPRRSARKRPAHAAAEPPSQSSGSVQSREPELEAPKLAPRRIPSSGIGSRHGGPLGAEARERLGLTQAELAERAGVSRQLVGGVEAGRHVPSVDAAIRLARALDVSVEDLFGAARRARGVRARRPSSPRASRSSRGGWATAWSPRPSGPSRWATPPGPRPTAWSRAGRSGCCAGAQATGLVVVGCDPVLGRLRRAAQPRRRAPDGGGAGLERGRASRRWPPDAPTRPWCTGPRGGCPRRRCRSDACTWRAGGSASASARAGARRRWRACWRGRCRWCSARSRPPASRRCCARRRAAGRRARRRRRRTAGGHIEAARRAALTGGRGRHVRARGPPPRAGLPAPGGARRGDLDRRALARPPGRPRARRSARPRPSSPGAWTWWAATTCATAARSWWREDARLLPRPGPRDRAGADAS